MDTGRQPPTVRSGSRLWASPGGWPLSSWREAQPAGRPGGCSHWGASPPRPPAAAQACTRPPRPPPALGGVVLPGPVETGVPGGPRGLALPGHPGRLAAPSLELQASVSLLDSRPLLPARPPAQAPHRASVAARGLALCSTRPPSLADPSAGPLGSSSAALGTPVSLHLSASPGPALGAFPRPDTPLLCHLDTASCSTPTCGLLPLKPRQISIAATLCLQRP